MEGRQPLLYKGEDILKGSRCQEAGVPSPVFLDASLSLEYNAFAT